MLNHELQERVLAALDWDPVVNATEIGVTADEGVVTLRGDVCTFAEKQAAERVALSVYGVKGVANDLNVRFADAGHRTDTEIARAAVTALRWSSLVPADR